MSASTRAASSTNKRVLFWGAVGVVGAGAYAIAQLGFHSQDRQYKKTLAYMHEGKEKLEEKMGGLQSQTNKIIGNPGKK